MQEGLDTFFMALDEGPECLRTVAKSAFSQAPKKLKPSAFVALNRQWVKQWHEHALLDGWFDMLVLAADGTCLRLPHLRENSERYGLGPVEDGSVAMARCVGVFSVARHQWLEMIVGRYDEGERELLLRALDQITPKDVLVLDRGYPAWCLFSALQVRKVNFCARIEGCGWKSVQSLLRSERRGHVMRQARGLPVPEALNLRLVKVCLPNGQYDVLATSLMDTQRFPTHGFGELYRCRWGIEEGFKLVKQR